MDWNIKGMPVSLNDNVLCGVTGASRPAQTQGGGGQGGRCGFVPHAAVLPRGSGLERAGKGESREDRCAARVHMAAARRIPL